MNTSTNSLTMSPTFVGKFMAMVNPETRQLMSLGHDNGWDFQPLGRAPMLTEPVHLGEWVLVPAHQDGSVLPDHAMERVQAIYEAGVRPVGFVLAHEVTMLLSAPAQEESEEEEEKVPFIQWPVLIDKARSALRVGAGVLGTIALGLGIIAGVAVLAYALAAVAFALLIPAVLVMGVAGIDPILIAVTEDGYWIEIDRWDV